MQPSWEGRGEEGVGGGERGGMGLEAAVGEIAPGGEGGGVDMLEELGFFVGGDEVGDVVGG